MGKSRPTPRIVNVKYVFLGGGVKGEVGQTKYLCALIHIWIKSEVGAMKPVKALQYKILTVLSR